MRNPIPFLFVLLAVITLGPSLSAEGAAGALQEPLLQPASMELEPSAGETAADCTATPATSDAADFEDFAGKLDARGDASEMAPCYPKQRTSYVCNCNLAGGTRYRKIVEEQWCCGASCGTWQTVSSSCTNYPC